MKQVEMFITKDIVKIFDVKTERLRQWTLKDGYIKPDILPLGKGYDTYYTRESLYTLCLFKKMFDFGLHRWTASHYAYQVHGKWSWVKKTKDSVIAIYGEPHDRKYWKDPNMSVDITTTDWVSKNYRFHPMMVVFGLNKIVREVDSKIKSIRR